MKAPDVDPDDSSSAMPSSLLQRLRGGEPEAWQRLLHLYEPLVRQWGRLAGLSAEDAADVAQEVFQAVARHVADFRRERPGDSFRGWLWTIVHNKIRDLLRRRRHSVQAAGGTSAQEQLARLPDPDSLDADPPPPAAEARSLCQRALALLQSEFEERTWRAFWMTAVEDRRPADVAAALGVSVGAVYIARSRVLRRLREEFGELL
jgi:RNA polymerase sigma-70 factor (ECF subfamily)